ESFAHDFECHALANVALCAPVDLDRLLRMGHQVDEPGADCHAAGIDDGAGGRIRQVPDGHDAIAAYGNTCVKRRLAAAVVDGAADYQDIVPVRRRVRREGIVRSAASGRQQAEHDDDRGTDTAH